MRRFAAQSRLAPLLLLLTVATLLPTASAQRQLVLKRNNDYCAGVPSSYTTGTLLELVSCQKNRVENDINTRQLWQYSSMNNLLRLTADSDLCAAMDVTEGSNVDADSFAYVTLRDCDDCDSRCEWEYVDNDNGDDSYTLINFDNNPDMCITYNDANSPDLEDDLIVRECPNSSGEDLRDYQWDFVTPPTEDGRLVYLHTGDDNCDKCVGVDYDTRDGATVSAVDCVDADSEDKYWRIDSGSSPSWCLDVDTSLCVEEEGSDLILRDSSSDQAQEFVFSQGNNNDQIEADSGRCVTLSGNVGSAVTSESCGSSDSDQRFAVDDYDGWVNDDCDGGVTDSGILIYLNADCDECIGVDSTPSTGDELVIVSCDAEDNNRKFWELRGTSGSQTWCLENNDSLCVVRGSGSDDDRLYLDDANADTFDFNGNDDVIELDSNSNFRYVTRDGNAIVLDELDGSGGNSNQQWNKDDYNDWDDDCDGGVTDSGILIYLNADCDECIGVSSTSEGEELTVVSCDSESSSRKYWELSGSSSSSLKTWCLDSNTNLCVVRGSGNNNQDIDRLYLDDDDQNDADADLFDFNGNDDVIELDIDGTDLRFVTRDGNSILLEDLLDGSSDNSNQRWNKDDFDDWDDYCDGGGSSSGELFYLDPSCGTCIGVPSNPGVGSRLEQVNCETASDERKLWVYAGGGCSSGGSVWCLESDPNLCVDPADMVLRDIRDLGTNQNNKWCREGRQIQPFSVTGECVGANTNSDDIDVVSCSNPQGYDVAWTIEDPDTYVCDQQSGNTPGSGSGDLIYLDSSCGTCIGVPSNAGVGSPVVEVNCENAADSQKLWVGGGGGCSSGGSIWCLADSPNLCVSPGTMTLKSLTSTGAEQSEKWCREGSQIQPFSVTGNCVGYANNGDIDNVRCDAAGYDVSWTIEDPDNYECDQQSGNDGGTTSDGDLIYLDSSCATCIGVPSNPGIGSNVIEVNCENAADSQKLWVGGGNGCSSGGSIWCLADSPNLCVRPSDMTLQQLSGQQSEKWCREGSQIQPFSVTGYCVGYNNGNIDNVECDDGSYDVSWTIEDPDDYRCNQQSGNNPSCAPGTLIYVQNDCEKCIGSVGNTIGLVDCANAADDDKLWNFESTSGGNWCLESSPNSCVSGDLSFASPSTQQDDDWTYGDSQSGNNKVARFISPSECITRSGTSNNLDLDDCGSGGSQDFTFTTKCDYQCFSTFSVSDEGSTSTATMGRAGATIIFTHFISFAIVWMYVVN